MISSDEKIRRIYIQEGFDEEPVGYDIGMIAENVDYALENGDYASLQLILENHFGSYVFTENGAHGIRYYNGNLSVMKIGPDGKPIIDPETGKYVWYNIPIGGGADLEIDGVLDPTVDPYKHTAKVYWIDPQDIMLDNQHTLVEWAGTRVVRKIGGYATNPDDPDAQILCDIERDNDEPDHGRNKHSTKETAILDTGADLPTGKLEYGQTYYYTFFTFKKLSNGDRKYSTGENVKKILIIPHEVVIEHVPYQNSEKEALPMYDETEKTPQFEYNTDPLAFTIDGDTSAINGRLATNPYYANFTPTIDYVWSDEICERYNVGPQETIPVPWRIRPQEINTPEITGPIDPEDSKITYTYSRNEFGGIEQGPTITFPELTPEDDNDDYDMVIFSDDKAKNANNYLLKAHLNNPNENDTNYIWKVSEVRDDVTKAWKIKTKLLPKPELKDSGMYDYTGETIEVQLNNYDPIYIKGENLSQINADSHPFKATFDLKNDESVDPNKNLKWEDESFDQIIINWSIIPKKITVPFITEPGTKLIYNTQPQDITPYISGYDEEYMTLINSQDKIKTDAGDYGLVFQLNNSLYYNYAWKDVPAEQIYLNQRVNWTIHKAENDEWTLDYPYKNGILPYNFSAGSTVIYNNKIHILGGDSSTTAYKNHYSYDGMAWTKEIDLPYNFYYGCAVVYNNRIHILGSGNSSYYTAHYSWAEGETEWKVETAIPYNFVWGCAIVYEDKIHIFGSSNNSSSSNYKNHFTWPETDENNNIVWKKQQNNLLYNTYYGGAVILNNTIYLVHGANTPYVSYLSDELDDNGNRKWKAAPSLVTGTATAASYNYTARMVVSYDNTIYCVYHDGQIRYLDANASSWVENSPVAITDIPITANTRPFFSNSNYAYQTASYYAGIVVYDNKIHILGGRTTSGTAASATIYHYECQKVNKESISTGRLSEWWMATLAPPYPCINGATILYKNKIHIFGGSNAQTYGSIRHYSFNGIKWKREIDIPYNFCQSRAVVWEDRIYLIGTYAATATTSATFNAYTQDSLTEPVEVTISDIRKACISIGSDENGNLDNYWRKETDLPQPFYDRGVVVYNDKIHLIGNCNTTAATYTTVYCYNQETKVWDDSTIRLVSNAYTYTDAIIQNDKIYAFGTWGSGTSCRATIYEYPSTTNSFVPVSSINGGGTASSYVGAKILFFDNKIHILGGASYSGQHISGAENVCGIIESTLPESLANCRQNELIYKDKILFFGKNNIYIYNNSAPSWSEYGIINIDTVEQKVFLNDIITIHNNKSTKNKVEFIIDEDQAELTDYCSPKIVNQTTLSFDLLRILYQTLTADKGQKSFKIKLNIIGDDNYNDCTKYIYINLIGVALESWAAATDKQIEILIKAKDYVDNEGHRLKIIRYVSGEKLPEEDFQLSNIWTIGEERAISHEAFSYIDNITIDTTTGQRIEATGTVARNIGNYKYILLDFRNDNIVGETEKVPIVAVGLKNMISKVAGDWKVANIYHRVNSQADPYTPWSTSLAKNFCDNMKKSFYLNYLVKERPQIGTLFLLSYDECRYFIDEDEEGKKYNNDVFEYYKDEETEAAKRIKRAAYGGSTGTAYAWWTRDRLSSNSYFYISNIGGAGNTADATLSTYVFSPAMYI